MKCKNVGSVDKTLRIIAGIMIISVCIFLNSWWGAVGLIPIFVAIIGWCPAYSIFGVSTICKK